MYTAVGLWQTERNAKTSTEGRADGVWRGSLGSVIGRQDRSSVVFLPALASRPLQSPKRPGIPSEFLPRVVDPEVRCASRLIDHHRHSPGGRR